MDVGGQAVIEGVMMRNKEKFSVAVRLPDGSIKVKKENSTHFPKFFNVPFIRGIVGLGYMLYDGVRALTWSSNQSLGEDEQLSKKELVLTVAFSFVAAAVFFVVIPFFSAKLIHSDGFLFDILDGFFRVVLLVGYMGGISLMSDVKRLFQYHGAEHKTIYCYESGQKLTVENVKTFSRFHPRCGTTFLFLLVLLSIVAFTFIQGPWWVKLGGRILLLPVISGVGYEFIKLGGRFRKNIIIRSVLAPGLWLQRLTTREPSDEQLEVSIKALKSVVN
ncbi:hypothetical protein COV20_02000 [Candidatus Woesearchaeota archaeon CG10_big_fil_rev_8_21_14_0_10_45_16]|nr:MAG: hypothetical protein COV20_02000 [Candidatus Woesearchaeota archaeon CG10_big_fil_rev_8_21_14_0_10_45_16]